MIIGSCVHLFHSQAHRRVKKRWCTPRADGPGSAPAASSPLVVVLLLHLLPRPLQTLHVYSPHEPLASFAKPFQPFYLYIRSFLFLLFLFSLPSSRVETPFSFLFTFALLSLVSGHVHAREEIAR